jgi:hypothetical protein
MRRRVRLVLSFVQLSTNLAVQINPASPEADSEGFLRLDAAILPLLTER